MKKFNPPEANVSSRKFNALDVIVSNMSMKDKVEDVLPKRYKRAGGAVGVMNPSRGYEFNPPLTRDEIKELAEKLYDIQVKSFTFTDVRSLRQRD